jgi:hypothetical protein
VPYIVEHSYTKPLCFVIISVILSLVDFHPVESLSNQWVFAVRSPAKEGQLLTPPNRKEGCGMVVTWEAVYKIADLLIGAGIFVCAIIELIPKHKKRHRHKKKK